MFLDNIEEYRRIVTSTCSHRIVNNFDCDSMSVEFIVAWSFVCVQLRPDLERAVTDIP